MIATISYVFQMIIREITGKCLSLVLVEKRKETKRS